ncbi:MAG: hypothetical protein MZU84_04305 [Sphingobacterium sp.]|nr:hypothetical protein [Sphingobacterium sp.]
MTDPSGRFAHRRRPAGRLHARRLARGRGARDQVRDDPGSGGVVEAAFVVR